VTAKEILIIAGPNGAGKTTFALRYLDLEARGIPFVNADLIASGLDPTEPGRAEVQAGRLMLTELDRHSHEGRSFAFETTLSGRSYLRKIRRWRADGYFVRLLFLRLPSADDAISRVERRVTAGGHSVPVDVIRRRFASGLKNFRDLYAPEVDQWLLLSSEGDIPYVLDRSGRRE
jgi:predicted ABC-type ATPase